MLLAAVVARNVAHHEGHGNRMDGGKLYPFTIILVLEKLPEALCVARASVDKPMQQKNQQRLFVFHYLIAVSILPSKTQLFA